MTGLLASVNSLEEAIIALENQVDIIDLKQPEKGALGALDIQSISQIVEYVNHRTPVSATIGDLPMDVDNILQAVKKTAQTNVDYIKIGFFPSGIWNETINALSTLIDSKVKLIAVLFADHQPDFRIISSLKKSGFTGVMLDTANKKTGSLTQVLTEEKISEFVAIAKNQNLLCGLAGSLRANDIPRLLTHAPDYLGFRGAICHKNNRTAAIDEFALQTINSLFMVSRQIKI